MAFVKSREYYLGLFIACLGMFLPLRSSPRSVHRSQEPGGGENPLTLVKIRIVRVLNRVTHTFFSMRHTSIGTAYVSYRMPYDLLEHTINSTYFIWFGIRNKATHTNQMVKRNPDLVFNHSSKFVCIANCYPRPVAIWPHDPLDDLDQGDERKTWFDVIDRNQDEMY